MKPKSHFELSNIICSYHRNGTYGKSFCVVIFDATLVEQTDDDSHDVGDVMPMVAMVFKDRGNIAIMNRNLLSHDIIEFGANSWRAEDFEDTIREAIGEWGN